MNQQEPIDERLLLQYLLGKATRDEVHAIDAWLAQDDTHRKDLDRLERVWLETGKLTPAPVAVDTEAAWEKVSKRMDELERMTQTGKERGRILHLYVMRTAVAAAALILVALGLWWFVWRTVEQPLMRLTSTDGMLTDTLADGTRITLNTRSTITYPGVFTAGIREVTLEGEAWFQVMRDTLRPFIVKTADAGVRVLGTAFDVKAYPGQPMVVMVSEGKVEFFAVHPVTGDTASVNLEAGMRGMLKPGSWQPEIDPVSPPDELFWMNQTLSFRDVPLAEVINTLNRCFGVTIRIQDMAIAGCRLTASFTGEPAETILQVIADTFSLTLETGDGVFILSGNGCTE